MELRPLRLLAFFALAAAAAVCGAAPGPRKQLAPSIASAASATLYAASLDRGALERVPLAAIFLLSVHGAVAARASQIFRGSCRGDAVVPTSSRPAAPPWCRRRAGPRHRCGGAVARTRVRRLPRGYSADGSRRRRGVPRGYSVESRRNADIPPTGRGAAAGCHADIPWRAAAARIFRRRVAAPRRRRARGPAQVIVLESRDARAARRASESPDAGSTRLIRTVLAEHAPVADGLSVRDR